MKVAHFSILVGIVLLGCYYYPGESNFDDIERLPQSNRLARFSSFPVDEQINIFLFAQISPRGKRDTYLRYLADEGSSKIEAIVRRVSKEERPSSKADLISVLDLIDLNCNCVGSPEVVAELTSAANPVDANDPNDVRASKQRFESILSKIRDRHKLPHSQD